MSGTVKPDSNASGFASGLSRVYPGLFRNVGAPIVISTNQDSRAPVNLLAQYTIPVDFCHSYNPNEAVGETEDEGNLPVVQGGLLNGVLDNAMTMGIQVVSGGRFVTTLDLTCQFLKPTRPGTVFAQVNVLHCTATVAYASVQLCTDEACTCATAFGTSTSKLRPPATSKL